MFVSEKHPGMLESPYASMRVTMVTDNHILSWVPLLEVGSLSFNQIHLPMERFHRSAGVSLSKVHEIPLLGQGSACSSNTVF